MSTDLGHVGCPDYSIYDDDSGRDPKQAKVEGHSKANEGKSNHQESNLLVEEHNLEKLYLSSQNLPN